MYTIDFFTKDNSFKTEVIKNDKKYNYKEYQNILLEAHKKAIDNRDLDIKRRDILDYLNIHYGFELI